jgi:hypothetical protein
MARPPATSGSEVDSGDVLGLLSDDGVDDGVREGLASSSVWVAPSIASSGGAGTRLEAVLRRWSSGELRWG